MKKIMLVFCAFVLMSFTDGINPIVDAFKRADTDFITQNFNSLVGIQAPGEFEFQYKKPQNASVWLNTFYTEKNITGFEQGKIVENLEKGFILIHGQLLSGKRKYTVVIGVKKEGDLYKIASLRFN